MPVYVLGLVICACLATAAPAQSEIAVPSGQAVSLSEVLIDEQSGEPWVRFRFIAPQIARDGGDIDYDLAGPDMDHLCRTLALPYLKQYGLTATRVVISLADRKTEFGAQTPEATQFFEAYRPADDTCIWEEF